MRKCPLIYQVAAVALSALIVFQFSGCGTLVSVPRSEIPFAEKNYCNIIGDYHKYRVTGTNLSDGMLTGTLSISELKVAKGNIIDLYVAPDSAIKVNGTTVTVPVTNIAKAEVYKVSAGGVITIAAGAASGAFWTYLLIVLLVGIIVRRSDDPGSES